MPTTPALVPVAAGAGALSPALGGAAQGAALAGVAAAAGALLPLIPGPPKPLADAIADPAGTVADAWQAFWDYMNGNNRKPAPSDPANIPLVGSRATTMRSGVNINALVSWTEDEQFESSPPKCRNRGTFTSNESRRMDGVTGISLEVEGPGVCGVAGQALYMRINLVDGSSGRIGVASVPNAKFTDYRFLTRSLTCTDGGCEPIPAEPVSLQPMPTRVTPTLPPFEAPPTTTPRDPERERPLAPPIPWQPGEPSDPGEPPGDPAAPDAPPAPAPGPLPVQPSPGPGPGPGTSPGPGPGTSPGPGPGTSPGPGPGTDPNAPPAPGTLPIPPGQPGPGLNPDGTPRPTPPPPITQLPPTVVVVPGGEVGQPGTSPQPTLEGIAVETGKIERKVEMLMGRPPFGIDIQDLIDALLDALKPPDYNFPAGEYLLRAPCGEQSNGAPGPPKVARWSAGAGELVELRARLDALAELIQHHKDLRQPVCHVRGQGQALTVDFVEDRAGTWEDRPLRKTLSYNDQGGGSLESHSAGWEGFRWEAGPVQVASYGKWGKVQVYAESRAEGERVIRHAAGLAGYSISGDPDHHWLQGTHAGSRIGRSGTMKVRELADGIAVRWRDGPSGPSYTSTTGGNL